MFDYSALMSTVKHDLHAAGVRLVEFNIRHCSTCFNADRHFALGSEAGYTLLMGSKSAQGNNVSHGIDL